MAASDEQLPINDSTSDIIWHDNSNNAFIKEQKDQFENPAQWLEKCLSQ